MKSFHTIFWTIDVSKGNVKAPPATFTIVKIIFSLTLPTHPKCEEASKNRFPVPVLLSKWEPDCKIPAKLFHNLCISAQFN